MVRQTIHKATRRQWVTDYKVEQGCIDCPERDPVCLDFDHKPGTKKLGTIAEMVSTGQSFDKVKAEIAKCDVRCANCHRKRHRDLRLASVAQS